MFNYSQWCSRSSQCTQTPWCTQTHRQSRKLSWIPTRPLQSPAERHSLPLSMGHQSLRSKNSLLGVSPTGHTLWSAGCYYTSDCTPHWKSPPSWLSEGCQTLPHSPSHRIQRPQTARHSTGQHRRRAGQQHRYSVLGGHSRASWWGQCRSVEVHARSQGARNVERTGTWRSSSPDAHCPCWHRWNRCWWRNGQRSAPSWGESESHRIGCQKYFRSGRWTGGFGRESRPPRPQCRRWWSVLARWGSINKRILVIRIVIRKGSQDGSHLLSNSDSKQDDDGQGKKRNQFWNHCKDVALGNWNIVIMVYCGTIYLLYDCSMLIICQIRWSIM